MSDKKNIAPDTAATNARASLSVKAAQEIGGAMHRLSELRTKAIVESGDANERRSLEAWLSSALLAHSSELLGCWFVVHNEYEPLIANIGSILRRVDGFMRFADAANAPAPAPEPTSSCDQGGCRCAADPAVKTREAQADNIIPLNGGN